MKPNWLCSDVVLFLKSKHTKERAAVVGLQLQQWSGFCPQPVSLVQAKHAAQVNGVVPVVLGAAGDLCTGLTD